MRRAVTPGRRASSYAALLRGVNVGGNKKVRMEELRTFFSALGFGDVRTVLQSGNVVFSSERSSPEELEVLLAAEARRRLGLETRFFVRGAGEWAAVVDHNPFPEAAERDPSHLLVLFLGHQPELADIEVLRRAIVGREVVAAHGRHVYAVYPDGIGRSRMTNAVIERALGQPCTGRNWNTVTRLAGMVEP